MISESPKQNKVDREISLAHTAYPKKIYKETLLPTPTMKSDLPRVAEASIAQQISEQKGRGDSLERLTDERRKSNPVLQLSREALGNLRRKWGRALIVRIFDGTYSTQIAKKRLQNLWKVGMQFQVKDIGKGFFVIHDLSEGERTSVIAGRPWKLGSSPITVRSWIPNFSVQLEATKVTTAVWATIHYLPIEYQSSKITIALGNQLGKTVVLD